MSKQPNIYIIAGPNGARKTTFAEEFLPHYAECRTFVNADTIARGLAAFSPDAAALKAGRLLLEQIDSWMLFDNSGNAPHDIAKEESGKLEIFDRKLYDRALKLTEKL